MMNKDSDLTFAEGDHTIDEDIQAMLRAETSVGVSDQGGVGD